MENFATLFTQLNDAKKGENNEGSTSKKKAVSLSPVLRFAPPLPRPLKMSKRKQEELLREENLRIKQVEERGKRLEEDRETKRRRIEQQTAEEKK